MTLEQLHDRFSMLATALKAMAAADICGELPICTPTVKEMADDMLATTAELWKHAQPAPLLAA